MVVAVAGHRPVRARDLDELALGVELAGPPCERDDVAVGVMADRGSRARADRAAGETARHDRVVVVQQRVALAVARQAAPVGIRVRERRRASAARVLHLGELPETVVGVVDLTHRAGAGVVDPQQPLEVVVRERLVVQHRAAGAGRALRRHASRAGRVGHRRRHAVGERDLDGQHACVVVDGVDEPGDPARHPVRRELALHHAAVRIGHTGLESLGVVRALDHVRLSVAVDAPLLPHEAAAHVVGHPLGTARIAHLAEAPDRPGRRVVVPVRLRRRAVHAQLRDPVGGVERRLDRLAARVGDGDDAPLRVDDQPPRPRLAVADHELLPAGVERVTRDLAQIVAIGGEVTERGVLERGPRDGAARPRLPALHAAVRHVEHARP